MNCFLSELAGAELAAFGFDNFEPVAGVMLLFEGVFPLPGEEFLILADHVDGHHLVQILLVERLLALLLPTFRGLDIYPGTYFQLMLPL